MCVLQCPSIPSSRGSGTSLLGNKRLMARSLPGLEPPSHLSFPSPNITCVPAQQGQKPISERAQLCLYNGTALGSGFPSHLRGPLPLRDLALVQGRWAVGTP